MGNEHGITCDCGQKFQNPKELQKHVQLKNLDTPDGEGLRWANQEELKQLAEWYVQNYGLDYQRAVETVNQVYPLVIDGYVTGSPGYRGKVLIEVGTVGPSHYSVFTWHDGQIERKHQAKEIREQVGQ